MLLQCDVPRDILYPAKNSFHGPILIDIFDERNFLLSIRCYVVKHWSLFTCYLCVHIYRERK